jgi:arabinofuranosyltransferase
VNGGEDSRGTARRPQILYRLLFALLCAAFVLHALRHAFLIDDAYISFHYARNLVEGAGLVLNPGERVEGYSNFLWVLLLAAGMKCGVAPETLSRALGMLAGLALLEVTRRLALRLLPEEPLSRWLALLAVAMLVASRTVAAWCTGGLETRLYTVLIAAGLLLLAREISTESGVFPWSAPVLGLALLTRTDGFLLVGILAAGLLLFRKGKVGRHGTLFFGILALTIGAQLAFRRAYYGEWLANTYYAKVPGLALRSGFRYLALAAGSYGLYLSIPLALLALERPSKRRSVAWLGCALLLGHLAYVASVGGDHFELRFVDVVWPLTAALSIAGARRIPRLLPARAGSALATALAGCLVLWNLVPAFRGFASTEATFAIELESSLCIAWSEVGRYFRDHAAPDEVIALRPAGVIPYVSRLRILDMEGLSDKIVARRPPAPGWDTPGWGRIANWEDVLIRARATYYVQHPDLRTGPATEPEPPAIVEVEGRRFALCPVRVPLRGFWLRFFVISEEAVVGDRIDASRIRSRIRP